MPKRRFDYDSIPWEYLSDSEIADELGTSTRTIHRLRGRLGKEKPVHLRVLKNEWRYRSLLALIDFYQWLHPRKTFTMEHLAAFMKKPKLRHIPSGWRKNHWIARRLRRNQAKEGNTSRTKWKFTPKFFSDSKKAGLTIELEDETRE